jgi:PAS domain S-box-containing protein
MDSLAAEDRTMPDRSDLRTASLEERRLRAIIESATDYAIITTDLDRRVTSWTAGAEAMLGWSETDILGRPLDILFTPAERSAGVPEREAVEALADGRGSAEGWRLRKDGSRIWASGQITPLRGDAGEVEGFLKIIRDRTAEQQEREEREAAQTKLTLALEAARMAPWEFDVASGAIALSPEFHRLLGLSEDADPSLDEVRACYLPGEHARITEIGQAALARRDQYFEAELEIRRADTGEHRTLLLRTEVLFDPDGAPERAVGVVLDITERKRAEEAAAAAHRRTTEILESISDAFYAVDDQWRFTYVNTQTERFWGRCREELLGKVYWEEFPQAVGSEPYHAHLTALAERRMIRLETVSPIIGRWIEVSIFPSESGLSVYFRDISERKTAEHHLRLMVHELNHRVKNSFAVVQAVAAQTLRSAASPDEARESFTQRLIALARAHDVITEENWAGADLRDLLNRTVIQQAGSAEARVSLEGPRVLLPPRTALNLSMTLHELTTNAFKYGALSREEGRIRLSWTLDEDGAAPATRSRMARKRRSPVTPPERRGFGSRLIERGLASEPGAAAELVYETSGLVCRVRLELRAEAEALTA